MIKSGLRFIVIALLGIALTGCNNDMNTSKGNNTGTDTNMGTDNGTGMKQRTISNNRSGVANQGWDNSRNNNFTPNHNNTKMEISNEIADAIAALDEVDIATVLLSNQNAYVAVVLDNGTGYGTKGYNGATGPKTTPNVTGKNATSNRLGSRGPTATNDEGVTEDIKAAIAEKVRSVQPDIDNVYVSANADFVGRMRGYGERFQDGQPIRGMIIEFNNLVKRIFPTAE